MITDTFLTPDDLHRWRSCARRFWLHRHDPVAVPDARELGTDAGADPSVVPGPAPGDALRASFPGAVVIPTPSTAAEWNTAQRLTALALRDPAAMRPDWTIFGACLASDEGARVRIDVLTRGAQGLRLFKVRLATVGEEADVDAVALWAHVAARSGLRLDGVGMLLVDTDFVYPGHGCHAGLFREVDLGPVLGSRQVASWLVAMRACDRGVQPPAQPGVQCTREACGFLDHCRMDGADAAQVAGRAQVHDPASLEIVGRELAAELRHEGHDTLHDVPEQRLADPRHRRAWRAVTQGAPVVEPGVAALIRAHGHPRYMLRFDTIGFAVPAWAGTRPYQVLPFQWNCDVEVAAGRRAHACFLGDAGGDPRRAFAQSLVDALGDRGPVYAYNAGFERNRIRELADRFDDLAPALDALLPRFVDLFQVSRAHYYHPRMRGSWSFRSIFAALAPDLDAGCFEPSAAGVAGRSSAQAAFARSLQPRLDAATRDVLRDALQAHGRRQTEALRRMVELFERAA